MEHIDHILVVDDDASLAEMLTIVLRNEGFDTAVVGDGTQALTAVRELRPDLVLLDLGLPDAQGLDALQRLREALEWVPVIVVSADERPATVLACLEGGAAGLVAIGAQGDD